MNTFFKFLTLYLFIILIAAGCGGGGGGGGGDGGSSNTDPASIVNEWTIFVYGHGDHNLSGSLENDFNKMKASDLNDKICLVMAADWNGSLYKKDRSKFQTGCYVHRILGKNRSEQLFEEPEKNFDDPAVLSELITKIFKKYKAKKYGIILWNHGGSWSGAFGGDTQDGTLTGNAVGTMTIKQIIQSLGDGLANAGLTGSKPLEFLAFDTCLMGAAEVSYYMKDFSKVYIANAELDFGSGWNYTEVLDNLSKNLSMTATEFARMESAAWDKLHKEAGPEDELLRSHISVDNSKLDALTAATKELADTIRSYKNPGTQVLTYGENVARAAFYSVPYYGAGLTMTIETPDFKDYGQFLDTIIADAAIPADIKAKASSAKTALQSIAIVTPVSGSLRTGVQFGFSIELPDISSANTAFKSKYEGLVPIWTNASSWANLISDLYASKSDSGPVVSHSISGSNIIFSTSTTSVATVMLNLIAQRPDDTSKYISYGMLQYGKVASGMEYTLNWAGRTWTIGQKSQRIAVIPWVSTTKDITDPEAVSSILAAYVKISSAKNKMSTDGYLLFDPASKVARTIVVFGDNNQLVSMSIPELLKYYDDAVFLPCFIKVNPAKDESAWYQPGAAEAEGFPSTGFVRLSSAAAASGSYVLETKCADVWGNSTSVDDNVTVP